MMSTAEIALWVVTVVTVLVMINRIWDIAVSGTRFWATPERIALAALAVLASRFHFSPISFLSRIYSVVRSLVRRRERCCLRLSTSSVRTAVFDEVARAEGYNSKRF